MASTPGMTTEMCLLIMRCAFHVRVSLAAPSLAQGHRTQEASNPEASNPVASNGDGVDVPILNKDMTLCISLSGRPSNIGTRFHNYLYDELGLNCIYKAFGTDDIEGAIRGVRCRRCAGRRPP